MNRNLKLQKKTLSFLKLFEDKNYSVFHYVFIFLFLLNFMGCKSSKYQKLLDAEERQSVINLLESTNFKIAINTITPSNGLYYEVKNEEYNIKISPDEISIDLPTIDMSAYSRLDKNISSENAIKIKTDYFTYEMKSYPMNIYTLHFVVKEVIPELDFSVIVTEYGDCTIYVKQGDWDNCGYLGSLVEG